MSDSVRVCFDMQKSSFKMLKRMADMEGIDHSQYVSGMVEDCLKEFIGQDWVMSGKDRRQHTRVGVSIPGVSCVKFSDREMRSYPVVVDDLSSNGVRISFKDITPDLADKLINSLFFEVFFSSPDHSQTISLYCRRLRHEVGRDVTLVGEFEGDNPERTSVVEDMMRHYLS